MEILLTLITKNITALHFWLVFCIVHMKDLFNGHF